MTAARDRPDPDALLAAIRRDERTAHRGRLKIFFGFSPGVGKTYAMLEAARRLRDAGVDVVAGIVETHGREETARLLEGLEVLPRAEVAYRGRALHEFDLDAALVRRPGVLLVDELAHTNAPGMRHAKRWQDVVELLDSGVDVQTTLNVQHVESLVDLVEDATGIRVRETVPDTVLERADDVELIDLPPDELLARLRDGKVYLPDVAARAVERFFKRSNLLQLRELALVRMARRAGRDLDGVHPPAAGRRGGGVERIVVGIGAGPGSARAIRDAARIAAGLRAEWAGVTVRRPFARPDATADAETLERNLRLAESLGGQIVRVTSSSVAEGLLDEARRCSATRIVVGRPRWRGWAWGRERVIDALVRGGGPIDVVVAGSPPSEGPTGPTAAARAGSPGRWTAMVSFVGIAVAAAFAAGWLLRPWVDDHDMSVVSLLIVVAATLRYGRPAGLLAVVLCALGIDLVFLHPEWQLAVADTKEIVSLVLLLSAGVVVAELVVRLRAQREMALVAERRLARLLDLSQRLAVAATAEDVAAALVATASDVTGAGAEAMIATPGGDLASAALRGPKPLAAPEAGVVHWCHEHGRPAGRGTDTLPGAGITCLPLREAGHGHGVLVTGGSPARDLDRDAIEMLTSACRQAASRLARLTAAD